MNDLHGASAKHVGWPDYDRISDRACDRACLVEASGDAAVGLAQLQPVDELLETVTVLGEVDGVGRGAEDRHIGGFERLRELERCLTAELHDDSMERAVGTLGVDDFQHVLGGERLEIKFSPTCRNRSRRSPGYS